MTCLVQISDCHLFADPQASLKGIRTRETLQRVLAHLAAHYAHAERLILTGDLAHDELTETYRELRDVMGGWLPRLRLVPGNHDDRAAIRDVLRERVMLAGDRVVFDDRVDGWRLIGLDSHVPGQLHGEIGAPQLAWLAEQLASDARPTLLFVHHPPVMVGSPWLDRIGLQDAAPLGEVVGRYFQVRGIFTGHVHQEFPGRLGTTPVFTTPSTGVQFRPRTDSLEVDDRPPGYRVLELGSDGHVTTCVLRVPNIPRSCGGAARV